MNANEMRIRFLLTETALPAQQAAERCGVDLATLVRWITRGKPMGAGGHRKLEAYPAGRSWVTTVEALARFLAASPKLEGDALEPSSGRTLPTKRELERFERARRKLVGAGR